MVSKAGDLTKKTIIVNEIKKMLEASPSVTVVQYNKINANSMNKLRAQLDEANGQMKIYKNSLFSLAASEKYPELGRNLKLKNAFIFANDIGIEVLRTIKEFSKHHKEFKIVQGIFNYEIRTQEQLQTLAGLPDKNGLMSMLLSALQGKVRSLLYALKEVAANK